MYPYIWALHANSLRAISSVQMKVCDKITYAELLQILSKADFPTLDIHNSIRQISVSHNLCFQQNHSQGSQICQFVGFKKSWL